MKSKGSKSTVNIRLYGRHAVVAALGNQGRRVICLYATRQALTRLNDDGITPDASRVKDTPPHELDQLAGGDAPHQGLVLDVEALEPRYLDELRPGEGTHNIVVVLDQVTDPHNVGAIIRSAVAFGASALITTNRHAPGESGALAKSASGALEALAWVRVHNLAHALDELAEMGYWRVGLDGGADKTLDQIDAGKNVALVLGAEGRGLRKGTAKHCDFLACLPISPTVESLNVSNAAAVALYELAKGR